MMDSLGSLARYMSVTRTHVNINTLKSGFNNLILIVLVNKDLTTFYFSLILVELLNTDIMFLYHRSHAHPILSIKQ